MSTTKRVFAKLSAQEPMKVEFAINSMVNSLVAGLKAQDENLRQQADLLNKYTSDLNILKSKADEQIRTANSTISNAEGLIAQTEKVKNEIRQQASEFGISPDMIPMYKELVDREQKIKSSLDKAQELNLKLLQAF
jgi:F0F1-type ATP synthase membrane subunit b/b'